MGTESKGHFNNSIGKMKKFLHVALEKKTKPCYGGDASLLHRINAPKLLLSMGMEENRVESIFWSVMGIERELRLIGKASFHDALFLLIDTIEYKNPPGRVTDGIAALQRRGREYTHLCVTATQSSLRQTLDNVAGTLEQANIVNPFMHGTSAANTESVMDNDSFLTKSRGRHDFGSGVYCFRDNMVAALSSAITKAIVYGGNPCVLVFLNPMKNLDRKLMNVNTKKIKDRTLKKVLMWTDGKFESFVEARNTWNSGNWENDPDRYWKTYVHLCRTFQPFLPRYVPRSIGAMGYLHNATDENIDNTNEGREPTVDPDRGMQYCFYEQGTLGQNILFVEFQFNFGEWGSNANAVDQDLMAVWRQHIQG